MGLTSIITGSFAVGESLTGSLVLNDLTLIGITTGSNHSGSTISFLVSNDNVKYLPLFKDTGVEYTISASFVARSYYLDPIIFYPWNYVQARLGTSASAILQKTVTSYFDFTTKKYIH